MVRLVTVRWEVLLGGGGRGGGGRRGKVRGEEVDSNDGGGMWGEVEGWCRKLWREGLGYSLVLLRDKVMLGLRGVEEKEVGEETY